MSKNVMSHHLQDQITLTFNCSIINDNLSRVIMIRDLGVLLNDFFTYFDHILYTLNNASRVLGFVMRNASHFRNITILKILYFSLIKSTLKLLFWSDKFKRFGVRNVNSVSSGLKKNMLCDYLTFKK